ncbi:MAG: hypothetical protein H0U75_05455 [Legionella sp.]|nr:hypothetical protein [Legionella sp.]
MPFFKKPEEHIADAKTILLKRDKLRLSIMLIDSRLLEFKKEMENHDLDEKQVEEQYRQFASTLYSCVTKAQESVFLVIDKYINNPNYYPVGVTVKLAPDPSEFLLFSRMRKLSGVLLLVSLPLFFMHPVAAGLILAGGLMLLLPSILYFVNPDRLNVAEKKEDDKRIFDTIKRIMTEPELVTKNTEEDLTGQLYPRLSA